MARKTKTTADNSGPKGPVVVEEGVEDAVEVTGEDTKNDTVEPSSSEDNAGDANDQPDDIVEPEVIQPDDDTPASPDEVETTSDKDIEPEESTEEKTETPEPAKTSDEPLPPVPAAQPQVTVQKVGFVPLVLGGVIAAALGFGAAWFYFGQQGGILSDRIADQNSRISELETQVAELATETVDLGPLEAGLAEASDTIAALSTRIDELDASVSAGIAGFDERLTAVERAPGVDGTLAETAIASWEQELDTLRAEIADQQTRLQDIAESAQADLEASRAAAQEVEQNAEEAAQQAVMRAALARVQVALDSGTPFDAALADLTSTGVEAPAALTDVASEGVPTISALNESFSDAARSALSAARQAGEADADTNPVTAFLRNQFEVRSVTPREGDDPDAILSRAGAALSENRLTDALAEIESLPEVARAAMSDWIAQAEARSAAMAAVESLDQSMNN